MSAPGTQAASDGLVEIRLHGRGGQGGVTCAKIIAAVFARQGKAVQTFGDYAGERAGAPVRAYARIADQTITNRNKVYQPQHVLVLDISLLDDSAVAGLVPGGTLLLNSPEAPEAFAKRFGAFRVATVDATAIARKHKIGTKSVVIVNTTLAGAFLHALGLPIAALEEAYKKLGFGSNLAAAKEAYEAVRLREVTERGDAKPAPQAEMPPLPFVLPLEEALVGAPVPTRTGNWRSQTPRYRKALAPCSAWCPAGNDVIGFVQAMERKDERAAATVLGRTTPLSAVCGRVCPAPCMEGCNRREYDGSVNIRGLERWIAEKAPVAEREPGRHPSPRRVAIVGGGPAGLSAAYTLARAGHGATIFEAEQKLGGVLRTGIPTYRLPRAPLDQEIENVLRLGVETRCGETLDRKRVADLARTHDAVILATGLQRLRGLDGPGGTLSGVEQGIRFLHRVNLSHGTRIAGRVVVLGGGNTAMDCARSALRAGASHVTVAYRRTREEMPAIREEIEEALHEGIELLLLRAPVGFRGGSKVEAVELAEVELGPLDASGRRSPVVTSRHGLIPCDAVLLALGQSADVSLLPEGWELREGRCFAGVSTTNVFAAGDLSTGDGTVAHAIGDGRRAAQRAMLSFGDEVVPLPRGDKDRTVPLTEIRLDHFLRSPPTAEVSTAVAARVRHFDEVNGGMVSGHEAARCFSCGDCTSCDTCLVYCPEGIIRRGRRGPGDSDSPLYALDLEYCKGCGICVTECPRSAMEMTA
jgi:2-oxoacid:acceptor oxidoreductase gamma subunit (pyruvate/2-ketoisovalerate family)